VSSGEKRTQKTNAQRERQRMTQEFKLEAVRLLERGEKPAAQLALELGVARKQLYKWQAQPRASGTDKAVRGPRGKRISELREPPG
jgi:transposase